MEGQPRVSNEWRGGREEGWGYGLGEERQQGSGQVSEERTLVGLTRAPPSLRQISHKQPAVVYRRVLRVLLRALVLSSAATVATLLRLLVVLAK